MTINEQDMQEHFVKLQSTFLSQRTLSRDWRIRQLEQIEKLLNNHVEEWKQVLFEDLGKQATEAWSTEIGYLLKDIRHTKRHLKKWMKPKRVSSPIAIAPARSKLLPTPKGTVAVFGAWNYPLQLTLSPVVAAIAAGNTVCIKPSEVSPATSQLIVKLCNRYLDSEAIWAVEGDAAIAAQLLNLPFDHIFFTGGSQIGKKVMHAAANHLSSVTLELGGKSPVIVSKHTDLEVTARRIVWGKFMNAGQTCIAPDYILVEKSVHEALTQALKAAIKELYGENIKESRDYGRIVSERHHQRLAKLLSDPELQHAKIWGGEQDAESRYFAPAIIDQCPVDASVMQEEIFGPLLPIIPVSDFTEALAFIQARPHPLACYLFSSLQSEQNRVEKLIRCGSLCINDTMVFMLNPNLPFGGVGESGMGSYHGKYGFDTFSHQKPVVTRKFILDIDVRYPPYTEWKQKILKKLLG
ncbi:MULTISPECIES: aldehyde dehydrogenase family protein [Gammaproteobacteria]|uniref:aldehyde dehydrogenase family protein n=1 Tax=Gammaproteobacteria TaxID=1236 RepID=UPI000DCF9962|nr:MULTISPECIES: aldehyde dehydrogenase family protein [Gammaproteobacteria]RTE87743.1 aldehyde dehydrogenase family protein [Aliidiomarina sp. B3213]TCZ92475.1 aldehyde dehydrogenase family protein [Lysobacter sp. N42]